MEIFIINNYMDKNQIFDHLKRLRDIYGIIVVFVSVVIGAHEMYGDITKRIEQNKVASETTQIMILKKYVRDFEKTHTCIVSDAEWEEYILNYSTLYDLKKEHSLISKDAIWMPIQRKENPCE